MHYSPIHPSTHPPLLLPRIPGVRVVQLSDSLRPYRVMSVVRSSAQFGLVTLSGSSMRARASSLHYWLARNQSTSTSVPNRASVPNCVCIAIQLLNSSPQYASVHSGHCLLSIARWVQLVYLATGHYYSGAVI